MRSINNHENTSFLISIMDPSDSSITFNLDPKPRPDVLHLLCSVILLNLKLWSIDEGQ